MCIGHTTLSNVIISENMWCIQVLRSPFFSLSLSGMEAGRNVKVAGDGVAVL